MRSTEQHVLKFIRHFLCLGLLLVYGCSKTDNSKSQDLQQELEKVQSDAAKNDDPRYMEAREEIDTENWPAAIFLLEILAEESPENPAYWNDIGICQLSMGENRAAVDAFQKSVEADPSYYRGFYNLGNSYVRMDEVKKAESAFEKAVTV
ncbi:MAG: tetratricopeptide repeat protein, partial [Verrucomicrobia bacterium]|nr:tetratricopeptide repeat protein [Verrucomicrobiota bacterium]